MVVDLREDPRIDMAMAQSIGNILKSVGQAEQNRQKRFRMDQIMSDISSGTDPEAALLRANSSEAPRDKGLAGVWQGAGRFIGGAPRNTTDAMIEKSLLSKLQLHQKQQDPLYQAQLESANVNIAGAKQSQTQSADTHPAKVAAGDLRNVGAQQAIDQRNVMDPLAVDAAKTNIAGAKQSQAQREITNPIEVQQAQQNIKDKAIQMGWSAEDADRKADNFTMQEKLFKDQQDGRISDKLYEAKKRALDLEGSELDNRYREAQIGAKKSGAEGSNRMLSLRRKMAGWENPTSSMIKDAENVAAADGYEVKKVDTTNYSQYKETGADGRKYRITRGKRYYPTIKYTYDAVKKPEASPPASGGEVVLQDDQGQVIGNYPDLPDRTYVEVNGKTFTIPNDQLNDFREAYPKASVYQIHKK
jgi:hypothetical protein